MKLLFTTLLILTAIQPARAELNVVTSTEDLSAIVSAVGKDKVNVWAIAKGTQDPHEIDAKPSFMTKMRNSDLFVAQGLELESAWSGPLIQGARNPKISAGSKGYLEVGDQLDPIEIPKGNVSRAEGDVHPGGNPHIQLDPIRIGKTAVIIADRLGELDSANKKFYSDNAAKFQKDMENKTKDWKARIAKSGVKEVVTYHKTFSYFCDRFEIKCNLQLEPKPGIPPTASHLLEVISDMKTRDIKLVLIENFYDGAAGEKIKQNIPNAKIAIVPVSVGGEPNIKTNDQLIEKVISEVEGATK